MIICISRYIFGPNLHIFGACTAPRVKDCSVCLQFWSQTSMDAIDIRCNHQLHISSSCSYFVHEMNFEISLLKLNNFCCACKSNFSDFWIAQPNLDISLNLPLALPWEKVSILFLKFTKHIHFYSGIVGFLISLTKNPKHFFLNWF